MSFLKGILNKNAKGRLLGKLAMYSISLDVTKLVWKKSLALEITAKVKIPKLDALIVLPTTSIKSSSFIRIFVYAKTETQDPPFTFDITKAVDINSETLTIGDGKFPASRVTGVIKEGLNDDKYLENILVHGESFSLLFELHISNNDEVQKGQIIEDFLAIVNSLKIVE